MWIRIRRWTLFGIVLALMALSACNHEEGSVSEDAEASHTETETYVVTDTPLNLDITASSGDIIVQRGEYDDRVTVEYTLTAFAHTDDEAESELEDMRVRIIQDDGTITVNAKQPSKTSERANLIDLVIDVPSPLLLAITHTTGNITVQDVDTEGPLRIQHFNGDVNVLNVSAPFGLDINHSTGGATFEGTIGDRGEYAIQLLTGTISVTLPPTTDAKFDAETSVGAVSYEGPELSSEARTQSDAGTTFSGRLGAGDGPTLSMRLTTGDIRITIIEEE